MLWNILVTLLIGALISAAGACLVIWAVRGIMGKKG